MVNSFSFKEWLLLIAHEYSASLKLLFLHGVIMCWTFITGLFCMYNNYAKYIELADNVVSLIIVRSVYYYLCEKILNKKGRK